MALTVIMFGVLRHEKAGEFMLLYCGYGSQPPARLGLGQIERHAIGLGECGNDKT